MKVIALITLALGLTACGDLIPVKKGGAAKAPPCACAACECFEDGSCVCKDCKCEHCKKPEDSSEGHDDDGGGGGCSDGSCPEP